MNQGDAFKKICVFSLKDIKDQEEEFWFDSIVLLAEATIKESYDIKTIRKV